MSAHLKHLCLKVSIAGGPNLRTHTCTHTCALLPRVQRQQHAASTLKASSTIAETCHASLEGTLLLRNTLLSHASIECTAHHCTRQRARHLCSQATKHGGSAGQLDSELQPARPLWRFQRSRPASFSSCPGGPAAYLLAHGIGRAQGLALRRTDLRHCARRATAEAHLKAWTLETRRQEKHSSRDIRKSVHAPTRGAAPVLLILILLVLFLLLLLLLPHLGLAHPHPWNPSKTSTSETRTRIRA